MGGRLRLANSYYSVFSFVVVLLLLTPITTFGQGIQFPIDHEGSVTIQEIGDMFEITGTWEFSEPPDWKDLIDWTDPCCASFTLIDQWDCNNPERHGSRSLFFTFTFKVSFPPKCEDTLCFWAADYPDSGHVCFTSNLVAYSSTAQLRDACNQEIRNRGVSTLCFADIDELVKPFAILRRDNSGVTFPWSIIGHFYVDNVQTWACQLYLSSSDSTSATYQADSWHIWQWFDGDTLNDFKDVTFSIPYGRTSAYNICGGKAEITIGEINFLDTLSINNIYGQYAICIPSDEFLELGTCVSIDNHYEYWPPECINLGCKIEAYCEDTLLTTSSAADMSYPSFNTDFESSQYQSCGFKDITLPITWKASVSGGSEAPTVRFSEPDDMTLRIFHGFRADSIKMDQQHPVPPADLGVGDTLYTEFNPFPSLIQNCRIKYTPCIIGRRVGHFKYGSFSPSIYRRNPFIADSIGNCQIYYIVTDTVSGYCDTSAYKLIEVKAKLKIDKPRRDTTFWISAVPEMPQIKCRAHIAGIDSVSQTSLRFNWKIKLKYKTFTLERTGSRLGIGDWIPNYGNDFGGDTVLVDVGVKYGADSLVAHWGALDSIRVLGKNPNVDSAKAYLRRGYEEPDKARQAELIGQLESNYQQFNGSGKLNGLPNIGADKKGVGMMQLTVATLSRNYYWNWKVNADSGKGILSVKWADSNSKFNDWIRLGWPKPTNDNRLFDTYCRYNGGRYYSNVIRDNDTVYVRNIIWKEGCGICDTMNSQSAIDTVDVPGCRQSGCCYSDHAMEIH